jgi:hypothetical protein
MSRQSRVSPKEWSILCSVGSKRSHRSIHGDYDTTRVRTRTLLIFNSELFLFKNYLYFFISINAMKTPSAVGEVSAVIAVLNFIYWASMNTPTWTLYLWISFGVLFVVDWMLGGIADVGICKKCWG